ncbi:MAG: hypothetical protein HQ534_08775 [Armatimonadetes bacterium]|nr:hypothetical protein [Armatimonadota bacterium]
MKTKSFILAIFVCIFLAGCATYPRKVESTQRSNLTVGTVKTKIIKGETKQAEILEIFGSPNLVTKNKSDNEVWNYNKMSFETATGSDGGTLILFGGSRALSTSTTKSFDLIITFDNNDVVKDYSVISASF